MSAQLQMAGMEVVDESGNRLVRIVMGVGPLAMNLTLEPDVAEGWLAWLESNLPEMIETVRRNNIMKGFEVVQSLPPIDLGRMNGAGGRG